MNATTATTAASITYGLFAEAAGAATANVQILDGGKIAFLFEGVQCFIEADGYGWASFQPGERISVVRRIIGLFESINEFAAC